MIPYIPKIKRSWNLITNLQDSNVTTYAQDDDIHRIKEYSGCFVKHITFTFSRLTTYRSVSAYRSNTVAVSILKEYLH